MCRTKIISSCLSLTTSLGFYSHKISSRPRSQKDYRLKNMEYAIRKIDWYDEKICYIIFIPVFGVIIGFPFYFGYFLSMNHDNLLYKMYPNYYQKKLDEYIKIKKIKEYEDMLKYSI